MVVDDRVEFERGKRAHARRMARDTALVDAAREVSVRADRYEWSYQWSFLGLPIIQMPSDIVALTELMWETRPTLVIETGIARGGSVILSAAMMALMGGGHVVAVDIDIRPHNREAIERHPLSANVTLIEGSSVDPDVVATIGRHAETAERVMVILDSDHTHDHVLAELDGYAPLVTVGCHLLVADTSIEEIPVQDHRPRRWHPGNSPASALAQWDPARHGFEPDQFVEDKLLFTASRGGYLRRVR